MRSIVALFANQRARALALRDDARQGTLLYELQRLKRCVQRSQFVAYGPEGHCDAARDPSDVRISRNLHNLANAAQTFHSTASSEASIDPGTHSAEQSNAGGIA
jgi:hypothetical protein